MTHPPQEVLLKVMCSERLPEANVGVVTGTTEDDVVSVNVIHDNRWKIHPRHPSHWYEPATRIVLTEEEYNELERKANE